MAEQTPFEVGAEASCSDGPCGEVCRIIIDPATNAVTHLVIEARHREQPGRLVPLNLVDTTTGQITLLCTVAEFDQLDPAEEREPVEGRGQGFDGMLGGPAPMGIPHPVKFVTEDVIPVGEIEVSRGDRVHALDGEIGQVHGFLVDPGDHRVTHVLLQEGHLWGRKEVAIPASAVTGIEDGIRLNITQQQVKDLPAVDIDRRA
jgi:sporulation protein YlmC with PRC-barrel domain